jgi:iron complex outermembrane receptor protein
MAHSPAMRTGLVLGLTLATIQSASAQDLPVTGSHIAGAPSLQPLRVIDRAELEASGYATFGDFLQRLPEQGAAEGPNVNNGGDGSTQMALHNLGAQRTLVLVDGKRWVPYSTSGAVDLSTIPNESIERIEILESGGSAIYGSGAIGGVVNIVTRRKSESIEASALGSLSSRGDARQTDLSVTSGVSAGKANVFFGAGFFDRSALLSGARGFATQTLVYDFANRSATHGGSPILPTANAFSVLGLPPSPTALYNFQEVSDLVTPGRQLSLFSNAEVRFSPIARAYAQASFVNRQSSSLLAPDPLTFGEPGTFTVDTRRVVEAGGRTFGDGVDALRAVVGIDGGLPTGLTFDLSFNYGHTTDNGTSTGTLQQSLLDSSKLFGPPGSLTQADLIAMGLHTGHSRAVAQLASTRLDVTQSIYTLGPAREATLAAGYEFRAEYAGYFPDPIAAAGDDTNVFSVQYTGSFHTNEAYVELDVPVLTQLDLRGAVRALDDSGFGGAVAWNLGGRWKPIGELTLHGSFSSNYRAPGIAERFDAFPTATRCNTRPCPSPVGNPGLEPEKSLNGTAGVSYEPQLLRGLFVSLDYWNISLSHGIGIPGCDFGTPFCTADSPEQNEITVNTSGLVLGLRYAQQSPAGRFGFRGTFSYLLRYDEQISEGGAISAAGNYDLGTGLPIGGLTPRLRFEATLDWKLGGFAAALSSRFIGGFDECADLGGSNALSGRCSGGTPAHSVPAYVTLDLQGSYSVGGTSLAAGIHNLANAVPPKIYDSYLTFADPAYDFAGRSVYARASQKF